MAPFIVDNEEKLQALLTHISQRVGKDKDQLLFVDLEGVNLGRTGKIAIMQLLIPPSPIVYLVDIHILDENAFSIIGENEFSLGSVLQSANIYKVFFDIRNDSDALYAHFGINVAGIIDLQVIEYATRNRRGRFVHGLAKCIERDLPSEADWSLNKAKGRRLFAPEAGGRYEVFLERPIPDDIIIYCEQDVLLMPRLLAVYGPKLRPELAVQLAAIVDERIALAMSATFNGTGKHMAIGPDLKAARADLVTSTRPEMALIQSARLNDLCRLDADITEDPIDPFSTLHIGPQDATSSSSNPKSTCGTSETSTTRTTFISSLTSVDVDEVQDLDLDHHEDTFYEDESYERMYHTNSNDDVGFGEDFTACSADNCGYCGNCHY